MICPGCGKLLPDGSRFCDDCGARLAEAPVSASPVFSEAPAAELESPAPKKKARWLLPLILGLVLVAAAALFLIWFFGDARAYNQAQALFEKGQYGQAESAFRSLGDYEDSAARADECRYQQARAAFDNGNYTLAQALFEALGNYEDSAEQVKACRYQLARQAFDKGDWEDAAAKFEALGDYSDSAEQLKACRYQQGLQLFEAGDLDGAAAVFQALGDYSDSAAWLIKCRPSPVGTWVGKINLAEAAGQQLGELAPYLADANVELVLELREDNSFTLTLDATVIMPLLKDAFLAYLNDMLSDLGMTAEDFEAMTGQSLDALIDEALAEMDTESLIQNISGTYTVDGEALVLSASGSIPINGTWEGDKLVLHEGDLGDIAFTRR